MQKEQTTFKQTILLIAPLQSTQKTLIWKQTRLHGETAATVANLVANPSYESVPPPIAQQSVEYDYIPDLLHGNMPASNSEDGTEDSNDRLTSVVYEKIPS